MSGSQTPRHVVTRRRSLVALIATSSLVAMACNHAGSRAPPPTPLAINVVVATIPLSGQPLVVLFATDGTPWIGRAETGSEAIEIDPASNATKREVPLDVGLAAASGAGALWFGSSSQLTRMDPATEAVRSS